VTQSLEEHTVITRCLRKPRNTLPHNLQLRHRFGCRRRHKTKATVTVGSAVYLIDVIATCLGAGLYLFGKSV